MSRVSIEFGNIIKSFLALKGITFRGASLASGVSAAYWKDMSDGRVPSEAIIERISANFDELDENELLTAAGYATKPQNMDAVKAVEFALRGQSEISDLGKAQILDFVREIEEKHRKLED